MKIAVIGTGYVGLVTAVVFTKLGHQVWGVDIDKVKISQLKKGKSPIYEPGLEELLQKGLASGRLSFTTSYKQAIPQAKAVFVCVGTPSQKDGSYDPKYVFAAAKNIAKHLSSYAVVVIKSTVPPLTAEKVKKTMDKFAMTNYDLASVPEFLREGSAVKDALQPARVVIGVDSAKAKKVLLAIHAKLPGKKITCDINSAQLVKYAANAFLATKISFINSLAILADKIGADINQVVDGFGSDPRIGKSFLQAGLGYGGSCFPKDTHALIAYSAKLGYDFSFLKQVDKINDQQVDYFIKKISRLLGGKLKGKTAAILGLAFKPETDDVREARSAVLINKLIKLGMKIRVYDPVAMDNARQALPKAVYFASNAYDCVHGAEVVCLVTEWEEFSKLDFPKLKKLVKEPNIADGRNFLPKNKLKKLGFNYQGIGVK